MAKECNANRIGGNLNGITEAPRRVCLSHPQKKKEIQSKEANSVILPFDDVVPNKVTKAKKNRNQKLYLPSYLKQSSSSSPWPCKEFITLWITPAEIRLKNPLYPHKKQKLIQKTARK